MQDYKSTHRSSSHHKPQLYKYNNLKRFPISQIFKKYQDKKYTTSKLKYLLSQSINNQKSFRCESQNIQIDKRNQYKTTQIQLQKGKHCKIDKIKFLFQQKRRQQFRSNKNWLIGAQQNTNRYKSQRLFSGFPSANASIKNQINNEQKIQYKKQVTVVIQNHKQQQIPINRKKYKDISIKELLYESEAKQLPKSVQNRIQNIRSRAKTQRKTYIFNNIYQGWNQNL